MAKTRNPNPETMLPLTPTVFSILLALAGSEKHGYAIMKEVALPENGAIAMGPGTLYGSLDRMMRSGLVEESGTTDDERRRYYRLTGFGGEVLAAEATRLDRMLSTIRRTSAWEGARS